MRLVQLTNGSDRRVAVVEEPNLRLLDGVDSVYALARASIAESHPLKDIVQQRATGPVLDYDAIYEGRAEWRLLPPLDHPGEPARCMVSGTGLTHFGSARDRNEMHEHETAAITDSMRMFQAGLEGGRPAPGTIGVAPEWFYKGNGTMLRAHGEALVVPAYAEDGGEEAEIAGLYIIDDGGRPRRVGMAAGNECSDHRFEKRNYLNLAGSKLRTMSLGPELVVEPAFDVVAGEVTIERGGSVLWTRAIASGEGEMSHSLANLEHHHFKFELHRRPGDVHVHFFGAHSLSFGDGIALADGDVVAIRFNGFGRALRNPIQIERGGARLVSVAAL